MGLMSEATHILAAIDAGDSPGSDQLLPLAYDERAACPPASHVFRPIGDEADESAYWATNRSPTHHRDNPENLASAQNFRTFPA